MSDTQIFYRYQDFTGAEQSGFVVCDRGVFKSYLGMYDKPNHLEGKFNNCALIAKGDYKCKRFLDDICNHWNSEASGWQSEFIDFGKKWYNFLKEQTILEIDFDCY